MKTAKEILKENRLLSSYWGRRIVKAEERGFFFERDHWDSNRWTTCACGRQDERIPRNYGRVPLDPQLRRLGGMFYRVIKRRKYVCAAEILIAIEKRSAEILRDIA